MQPVVELHLILVNSGSPGADEAGAWSDWDKKSPGSPFSPAGGGEHNLIIPK